MFTIFDDLFSALFLNDACKEQLKKEVEKPSENDEEKHIPTQQELDELLSDFIKDINEFLSTQASNSEHENDDEKDEECDCDDCCCTCKIDFTEKNECALPSTKVKDIESKMQLHNLVSEYMDKHSKIEKHSNEYNDMYAELFEFACYILTK